MWEKREFICLQICDHGDVGKTQFRFLHNFYHGDVGNSRCHCLYRCGWKLTNSFLHRFVAMVMWGILLVLSVYCVTEALGFSVQKVADCYYVCEDDCDEWGCIPNGKCEHVC